MPILVKFSNAVVSAVQSVKQRRTGRSGHCALVKPAQPAPPVDLFPDAARLERQLILPCNTETPEEKTRATLQDRGQFLARQDLWPQLSVEIRRADHERALTRGGMAYADLLAYGARADVVQAVEDAIYDGADPDLSGIEAFEVILAETPQDPAIALIVALAHMDIGWAWRGDAAEGMITPRNLALFQAHFSRARAILANFCSNERDAPSLAAARVALLAACERPQDRVADDYEDLINLDPANFRAMRSMGNHLLPRWFGTYAQLELEARRTAARTLDIWGAGGYTWAYMDALVVDPWAVNMLDVGFFVEGLRDILERRPDQHMANQIAAYCAITMAPQSNVTTSPNPNVHAVRAQINDCFGWVLSDHLRELHPLIWAQAAHGPDVATAVPTNLPSRDALWQHGHTMARRLIARHFKDDLTQGTTITFSRHGMRLYRPM